MESDIQVNDCFELDGVVAEMVIEVDDDMESPQKALKLDEIPLLKTEESPFKQLTVPSDSDQVFETNTASCGSSAESETFSEVAVKENNSIEKQCSSLLKSPSLFNNVFVSKDSNDITEHIESLNENDVSKTIPDKEDQVKAAAKDTGVEKDEILKIDELIQESTKENVGEPKTKNPESAENSEDISPTESTQSTSIETLTKHLALQPEESSTEELFDLAEKIETPNLAAEKETDFSSSVDSNSIENIQSKPESEKDTVVPIAESSEADRKKAGQPLIKSRTENKKEISTTNSSQKSENKKEVVVSTANSSQTERKKPRRQKIKSISESEKETTISEAEKKTSKRLEKKKPLLEEKSTPSRKENKSEAELALKEESLENFMPTAVSTRGNKRKLVEIEGDTEPKKSLTDLLKSEKKRQELTMYSKPRMFNYFTKDCKFEKFYPFIKVFNEADAKYQRQFYRVLFDKWAPIDINKLKKEVYQFSGYPFRQNSEEVLKRKHILAKLSDTSVTEIYKMLDLSTGSKSKDKMITDIVKFLLKPSKNIFCVVDPFEDSMQPIVLIEKLSFENEYLVKTREKSRDSLTNLSRSSISSKNSIRKEETVKTTPKKESLGKTASPSFKRKADVKTDSPLPPKRRALAARKSTDLSPVTSRKSIPVSKKKTSETESSVELKSGKPTVSSAKKADTSDAAMLDLSFLDSIPTIAKRDKEKNNATKKAIDIRRSKAGKGRDDEGLSSSSHDSEKSRSVLLKNNKLDAAKVAVNKPKSKLSSSKNTMKNSIKKLRREITKLKEKVDETIVKARTALPTSDENEVSNDASNSRLSAVLPVLSDLRHESASSDTTLSADEVIHETKKSASKKKKTPLKKRPLRSFPNIKESIEKGSFSALQRLHIVLFGASDKPENLKANILAFGGFPFLESSNEWKQKEFLLSLLSLNTLKEYMSLLCMEYDGDDQQTMISKLMKFLAQPKDPKDDSKEDSFQLSSGFGMKTKIVRTETVKPPPKAASKKKVKKPEKKTSQYRYRKVIMDEAQVRRLEADIAREQRIREREKRFNEQMQLKKQMAEMKKASVQKTVINKSKLPASVPRTPLGTTYQMVSPASIPKSPARNIINMPLPSSLRALPVGSVVKMPVRKTPVKPPPPLIAPKKVIDTKPTSTSVVKQSDTEQLNALLQTVYKRRALKAAGAIVSTLKEEASTKLGELPNVKFLVVTANFSDLDVLHHLLYLTDAPKHKVRKNILDFSGFDFNEDSLLHKERMDFLNSLGYDISKRVAFLLGLCPYKTEIDKQDLNELIMYFLMSPCKTKQVPITHLPQTFFSQNMPEELCLLMQRHGDLDISIQDDSEISPNDTVGKNATGSSRLSKSPSIQAAATPTKSISSPSATSPLKPSTSAAPSGPKAKKSFKSSCLPPAKKKPALAPSISTIPFKSARPVQKPPPAPPSPNPHLQSSSLQKAVQHLSQPDSSAQEFLIQQQTPDGKQKTYKLIKLPASQTLSSVLKPQQPSLLAQPASPVVSTQTVQSTSLINQTPPVSFSSSSLTTLPPGIIIFKSKNDPPLSLTPLAPSVLPSVPVIFNQPNASTVILPQSNSNVVTPVEKKQIQPSSKPIPKPVPVKQNDHITDSDENDDIDNSDSDDEDIEIIRSIRTKPPTDKELFSSIEEVINNSNFEDITLRNVIDRVSAQYSDFDLTSRHTYMKECVKKIIIGT